jgi:hypothetical protein
VVIAKQAIPMELEEILEDGVDIVERVGAVGVASQLDLLPGRAGNRPVAVA